jgi:hypothetical protein
LHAAETGPHKHRGGSSVHLWAEVSALLAKVGVATANLVGAMNIRGPTLPDVQLRTDAHRGDRSARNLVRRSAVGPASSRKYA